MALNVPSNPKPFHHATEGSTKGKEDKKEWEDDV